MPESGLGGAGILTLLPGRRGWGSVTVVDSSYLCASSSKGDINREDRKSSADRGCGCWQATWGPASIGCPRPCSSIARPGRGRLIRRNGPNAREGSAGSAVRPCLHLESLSRSANLLPCGQAAPGFCPRTLHRSQISLIVLLCRYPTISCRVPETSVCLQEYPQLT